MNTRILMSVLVIVAVVAGVSAVTFAFFSDQGTSTDNVFGAGTIILKLSNNDITYSDNVTATIGGSNMVPGDTFNGTLYLQNTGSHEANHVDIAIVDTNTPASPNLDKVLKLTTLTYGATDLLATLPDNNANGYKDLADLATADLSALTLTDFNVHTLTIAGEFDSNAGNEYQGGSVTTNWTITLNQDSTQ